MKLEIYDLGTAKSAGEIDVDDAIFGPEVREHLFWEVVNWQRARRRAGTHKTKVRSEVAGGGKKPWKQKGTGRARQGTTRAPHWVGGGTVFGPSPRDYSYAMPKKKRRAALRSALSQKAAQKQIRVVDALHFDAIRTKEAAAVLNRFAAPKALFVDTTQRDEAGLVQHNETLRMSVRNLKNAKYLAAEGLNVEDLLKYDILFISKSAVAQVQEALS
jgi:large subunit ribosomal protein L4